MNLIKWNYRPMPGIFENFFRNEFLNERDCDCIPAVNISENDQQFELHLSAAGLKKEDFNIKLERDTLTISSEKKEEKDETTQQYSRREFFLSSFSRSFTLPQSVDRENIKANYENGILQVILPKKEEAKTTLSKEITIG